MSGSELVDFQDTLSRAQSYPLIGPILVSPIKALVSVIQTIVCIAGVVFFGPFSMIWERPGEITCSAFIYAGMGLYSFAYSIINILSLGIVGFRIEKPCAQYRPL